MTTPTVIRADLPSPDAVIVRKESGELVVVVDHRVADWRIAGYLREAPHCRNGRPLRAA